MNCRSERKRKCKACRDSSGVLIYFWQDIRKGVKKVESTLKDAIWLRLYKNYFGLNKDLYLCTVYIPPRNSPTYVSDDGEDMHDIIGREIDIFLTLVDVAIKGDMNSRVGCIQEKHYGHGLLEWGFVTGRNWSSPEHPWHSCQYTWQETLQLMTNYDMILANRCICGGMFIVQRDLLPIIRNFKSSSFLLVQRSCCYINLVFSRYHQQPGNPEIMGQVLQRSSKFGWRNLTYFHLNTRWTRFNSDIRLFLPN